MKPSKRLEFERTKADVLQTTERSRYQPGIKIKTSPSLYIRVRCILGLWHPEAEATIGIFLQAKTHIMANEHEHTVKMAAKGVARTLPNIPLFHWKVFRDVLFDRVPRLPEAIETGMRVKDGRVMTYELAKRALSPVYVKRYVYDDKMHTTTIADL